MDHAASGSVASYRPPVGIGVASGMSTVTLTETQKVSSATVTRPQNAPSHEPVTSVSTTERVIQHTATTPTAHSSRERLVTRSLANLREAEERAVEAEVVGRRERESRLQAERERIRVESLRVESEAVSLNRERQAEQWARRERELRLAAEAALEEAEATALAWDLEAERQEREKAAALQDLDRERQARQALESQLRAERSAREAADHRAANAELTVKENEARVEEANRRDRQARAEAVRSTETLQQRVLDLEDQLRKERTSKQALEDRARDAELQAHGLQLANDDLVRAERASRLKAEERAAQAERDAAAADDRTRVEAARRAELENALAVETMARKSADERIRDALRQSDMDRAAKVAAEGRIAELAEAYQRERRARLHAETMAHHLDAVAGSERLSRVDAEARARIVANRESIGRGVLDKAVEPWTRQELVQHRVEERVQYDDSNKSPTIDQKLLLDGKRRSELRLPPARLPEDSLVRREQFSLVLSEAGKHDGKPAASELPATPRTRETVVYRRSRSPPTSPL